jgi:hypothetical protein
MTIFVFAAVFFVSPILASSDQDTASVAIANAEETVVLTYEAVLEAEQAEGNITGLLAQLNEAGEFLAAARMLYSNGDFDNAVYFADLSRSIGEEVENEAYELKDLASDEGVQRVWFTMLGSISGIILVVLGSLRVWWFLKRRYQ